MRHIHSRPARERGRVSGDDVALQNYLPQCDISMLKDAGMVHSLVVQFANIWAFQRCRERQEKTVVR
jgi:hypothetical protein